MKKVFSLLLAILLLFTFSVFALGSTESEGDWNDDQGTGKAESSVTDANLDEYNVVIKSCRLAEDYKGNAIVIVKYGFTNNSDDAKSFLWACQENVYQNGVGLNESWFVADSANYSSDNQTKDIKKGTTIEVEVAYELNDTTTDIEVEVKEFFDFSDRVVTKTFSIQ